jgi:hypothetical protein
MARQGSTKATGTGVVLVALVIGAASVYAGEKDETFAASVLQGVTLVVSLVGSWVVARVDVREAGREMLRPHVSSAFRRVKTHWEALARAHDAITDEATRLASLGDTRGKVPLDHVRASLVHLQAILVEQLATAQDSLTDWREILPEEVARIESAGLSEAEARSRDE